MQDLAGHEGRILEVEDRAENVGNLAHMSDRVKAPERLMGFFPMGPAACRRCAAAGQTGSPRAV
jgi:hypothetical protein